MQHKLKIFSEYSSIILLVLVGVLGIFVSVLDFIGTDFESGFWKWLKGPIPIILLTISLLALTLGIERYVRFRDIEENFKRIENLVSRSAGGLHLIGTSEIYAAGTRLVSNANKHIRASIFATGPKAPESFVEALINRMKQKKREGNLLNYEAVLVMDMSKLPQNFREGIESRNKKYEKASVGNQVSIYLLNVPPAIDFDVLIVDDQHVLIAFPTLPKAPHLQSGVLFENQPRLAKEFISWFEQRIVREAIRFEDWISQQGE